MALMNLPGYYDINRDQYLDEQQYRNRLMQEQMGQMQAYQQQYIARASQAVSQAQNTDTAKPNLLLLLED